MAQTVKNLPAMQEAQVRSLGQKDPLEKGMATHSRILAWRTPWTEEPGGLQSMGLQRVGHDWATQLNWTKLSCSFTLNIFFCLCIWPDFLCCVYVVGRLATFPGLIGVALCRRCAIESSSVVFPGHQSQVFQKCPLCGLPPVAAELRFCRHVSVLGLDLVLRP